MYGRNKRRKRAGGGQLCSSQLFTGRRLCIWTLKIVSDSAVIGRRVI